MFFIFKTKPFTQSNAKQQFQANSVFKLRPDLDNSNSPNVTLRVAVSFCHVVGTKALARFFWEHMTYPILGNRGKIAMNWN